jgi:hypothetical protein
LGSLKFSSSRRNWHGYVELSLMGSNEFLACSFWVAVECYYQSVFSSSSWFNFSTISAALTFITYCACVCVKCSCKSVPFLSSQASKFLTEKTMSLAR